MFQFGAFAKETLEQLSGKGLFLTVKKGDTVNTMTIGWGSLSQYWGMEVFIAPVRFTRYTFDLLKDCDEFTVSVPASGKMDEALKICGTASGRNGDKKSLAGITYKNARELSCPVVDGCEIYYECKLLTYTDLDKANLPEEISARWYGEGNALHRLFFGKIVTAYK